MLSFCQAQSYFDEGLIVMVYCFNMPEALQPVTAAEAELFGFFGRKFNVPQPPADLFETLENFNERGILGFDEIWYWPKLQLEENDKVWIGRVKPEPRFWQQIKNGYFPREVAMLLEGWYIGDRRGKPNLELDLQQMYEDDYLALLMKELRGSRSIQRHDIFVPDNSRCGASPQEIERVILSEFARINGAKGIVGPRRYIEFNVRGNMVHPEWGQTNTWEWFGDSISGGKRRLMGGPSYDGGLAHVFYGAVNDHRFDTGFSPVIRFPSKSPG